MQISQHFSLHEFTRSNTATRMDIDNFPSNTVIENLEILALDFLEPIRKELDSPIIITSGYRSPVLNRTIGGSKTSSHMYGEAVDFGVIGMTPLTVCKRIRDMGLNYDQLIHEFGKWVHLGIGERRRKEDLTAYRHEGKTIYVSGIHAIEDILHA